MTGTADFLTGDHMANQEPKEDGPRAPLLFLSYSQNRAGSPRQREYAHDLFRDLSTHISELVGMPTGVDAGFIDRSMGGGERWTPALLSAVGRCQVFVPLVSPLLAASKWCGMEWHAFSRRKTVDDDGKPVADSTCILPVIWVPRARRNLPAVVNQVQSFTPNLPFEDVEQYEANGLYGLRAMGERGRPAFDAVIWRLAQRVVALHQAYQVEPWEPTNRNELVNVFRGNA